MPTVVTIVSGLPRSGTSLMMQMLEAGGMEPLTDGVRAADDDNPRGYYEFEAVKTTRQDPSWLASASGRAVKMVHVLLHDLPPEHRYRVVFMKRELDEVVRSQRVMLERAGTAAKLPDAQLRAVYASQYRKMQEWLEEQPNFEVLWVDYNALIEDPAPAVEAIGAFLGGGLDHAAMRAVIDPDLYRQRS
jgi:hypothetical protein